MHSIILSHHFKSSAAKLKRPVTFRCGSMYNTYKHMLNIGIVGATGDSRTEKENCHPEQNTGTERGGANVGQE